MASSLFVLFRLWIGYYIYIESEARHIPPPYTHIEYIYILCVSLKGLKPLTCDYKNDSICMQCYGQYICACFVYIILKSRASMSISSKLKQSKAKRKICCKICIIRKLEIHVNAIKQLAEVVEWQTR